MAAATVDRTDARSCQPFFLTTVELSSLTSDQTETVSHSGPTSCSPVCVFTSTIVSATSGDLVVGEWIKASDSTSNNTCAMKFKTTAGGDIAGAKVRVTFLFLDQATGGISA